MKGYYNKPKLTAQTLIDGWVHTGNLAEIDENGFVYIYGRCSDAIILSHNQKIYLFDIANKIKEAPFIDDCIVLQRNIGNDKNGLVAHIVWDRNYSEEEKIHNYSILDEALSEYLPVELNVYAYAEHEGMLPYSPTTLKKDKNLMSKQRDGFWKVVNGELKRVEL